MTTPLFELQDLNHRVGETACNAEITAVPKTGDRRILGPPVYSPYPSSWRIN